MDQRKITEQYSVAPQISLQDIGEIAAMGFTTLVCNRPDAEDPGQPGVAEIAAEAKKHHLDFHHIPTSSGAFNDSVVAQHKAVLEQSRGPVFAYCRSGTRCTILWALANAGVLSASEIIGQAAQAGYDISGLQTQLAQSN